MLLAGLNQDRNCEHLFWGICTGKNGELQAPIRGKEGRKYSTCGEMSPGGQSQGTEIVEEVFCGEGVQFLDDLDTL